MKFAALLVSFNSRSSERHRNLLHFLRPAYCADDTNVRESAEAAHPRVEEVRKALPN